MRRLLLLLAVLTLAAPASAGAATREYWIGAVPGGWNVIPNAHDPMTHAVFPATERITHTVLYRRFTRGWRSQFRNDRSVSGDNDGIPGPLLRARVGDTVLVHFRNFDPARSHSMHFHGVSYGERSDGSYIPGFSGPGGNVRPGKTFTYRLKAGPDAAGVWAYHDHSPSMHASIAGGLYGALSILGRTERAPDREFVVVFSSMLGHQTINGRAFLGNTPVFHAKVGDVVQWDVLAIGEEHHTFHVHGHRWVGPEGGTDVRTLGPAESFRVRWREDAPGAWLYHCHVEGHMGHGMIGLYRVGR
jgi:FtsP/CotA-like multicopper oxidase with cupredoxin domain